MLGDPIYANRYDFEEVEQRDLPVAEKPAGVKPAKPAEISEKPV